MYDCDNNADFETRLVKGISIFDPAFESHSYLRDMLEGWFLTDGLAKAQFLKFIAKCKQCSRVTTKRSQGYHACPTRRQVTCYKKISSMQNPEVSDLFQHLDVVEGGHGLSEEEFGKLFVCCNDCHRFYTTSAVIGHLCGFGGINSDSDDK